MSSTVLATDTVTATSAVESIKSHGVFPTDMAGVRRLVELSRDPETSLAIVNGHLRDYHASPDKEGIYRAYGKAIQFISLYFDPIRESMRFAENADGTAMLFEVTDHERVFSSELARYSSPNSLLLSVAQCQEACAKFYRDRVDVALENLPQSVREEIDYEGLDNLLMFVFGGMHDGASHLGAASGAIVEAYEKRDGIAPAPDLLRAELHANVGPLTKFTELNIFEVRLFDFLVQRGYNPYVHHLGDDMQGAGRLEVRTNCVKAVEELEELLASLPEPVACRRAVKSILQRHLPAHVIERGALSRRLANELSHHCEQNVEDKELASPRWAKALGCPAARARVLVKWLDLMTDIAVGYYEVMRDRTWSQPVPSLAVSHFGTGRILD